MDQTDILVPPEQAEPEKKKTRGEVLREKADGAERRRAETEKVHLAITRNAALEEAVKVQLMTDVVISGIEEIRIGELRCAAASAFTEIGGEGIRLTIPFKEMMTDDVIDMSTIDLSTSQGRYEYFHRQQQMLSKFLGLEVSVCITEVTDDPRMPGEKLIAASRREAAQKNMRKTFFSKDACRNGDLCTGKVMTVGPHSLLLSFGGVDTVVHQGRISYRYMPQLDERYRVNDRIEFIMSGLKAEEGKVSFSPDAKGAELLKNIKRLSEAAVIYPGTRTKGIITSIRGRDTGRLTIQLWLPDYDLPAFAYSVSPNWFGSEPKYADEVLLAVDEVKRDKGYLSAHVLKLLGNMSMFTTLR